MRKLVVVVAAGLAVLGFLALMPSPANAELKVSITGNMRLNAHYVDVIGRNGDQEEIGPTNLPFTAGPSKDKQRDNQQTMIDARRSRLQAVISDEVGAIKLNAFYQGDFDTADGNAATSNARVFRMRVFWAQAQTPSGWIMRFGQIRSTVSEFGDNLFGGVAAPDIVDENGHWDQLQARQPGVQVAYATKWMGGDLLVGVAVEKSASAVLTSTDLAAVSGGTVNTTTGSGGTFNATANNVVNPNQGSGEDVPLFAAAARYRNPLWAVFVRGAAQKHRVILCTPAQAAGGFTCPSDGQNAGHTTALTGWLGAIGAEVTPGPLTVYAQYYYADGLNRLGGTFSDVSSLAGGFVGQAGTGPANGIRHLKPIDTHNWHAGAEYKLTKDLKFVTVYEWQQAVANRQIFNLTATSTDKRDFQAVHAGFGYSFWSRFNFGLEYEWGRVKAFGDNVGIMNAVNSRLHFYF